MRILSIRCQVRVRAIVSENRVKSREKGDVEFMQPALLRRQCSVFSLFVFARRDLPRGITASVEVRVHLRQFYVHNLYPYRDEDFYTSEKNYNYVYSCKSLNLIRKRWTRNFCIKFARTRIGMSRDATAYYRGRIITCTYISSMANRIVTVSEKHRILSIPK